MDNLESKKQLNQLTSDNKFVLVDFSATWCQPCKKLTPVIDDLAKDLTSIKFVKADIEDLDALAEEYGVEAVPTLVLLKDGKEVDRVEGAVSKAALKTWLMKVTS
jgi:thioredoxin 1